MRLREVLIFVVGATTGGLLATKIVSDKYEKIIKKEVLDLRESLKNTERELKEKYKRECECSHDETVIPNPPAISKEEKEELIQASNEIAVAHGYSLLNIECPEPEDVPKAYLKDDKEKPYPIAPSMVGELGYAERRLIRYADGVITEEDEDIIYDIDDIVGVENLEEHIGDYEPRMLYVRNDKYRSDYILFECDDYYTEDIIETPRGYHD